MAVGAQVNGDLLVAGNVIANGLVPGGTPAAYITDALIAPAAAIAYGKVQPQETIPIQISDHGSVPTALQRTVLIVKRATGTLLSFTVTTAQAFTSGSMTVDLKKNGTTCLSSTVALNSTPGTGGTAFDKVTGTITVPAAAAGDVYEIVTTVSSPVGAGGVMAQIEMTQSPM